MDGFAAMMADVQRECPKYNKKQKNELYEKMQNGDMEAREQLILCILPWAINIAKKYQHRGPCIEDLTQAAMMGCIDAVDQFEPEKGQLTTYATFHVLKYIKRLCADDRLIHVPLYLQCNKVEERYQNLLEHVELIREIVPLQQVSGEDHPQVVFDDKQDDIISTNEQIERIRWAMSQLPIRHRQIIEYRMEGMTLGDVGKLFGLTRGRIRQLEQKGHETIRNLLQPINT
jgi:RNA polymerase sporulation-specific sigma factor